VFELIDRTVNIVYCFLSGARRAPFNTINLYFNCSTIFVEKCERFNPAPEGRPAVNIWASGRLICYGICSQLVRMNWRILLRRLRNKIICLGLNICYGVCSQIFQMDQNFTLRRFLVRNWVAEKCSWTDSEYAVAVGVASR
jgi:hypothetical protein